MALLTACSSTAEPEAKVSVVLSQTIGEVTIGETLQLQAVVQNGVGVTWLSDRPGVATVSASGLVTGVSSGTASVTATASADPAARATSTITVKARAPTVVSISPAAETVDVSIGASVSVRFAEAISATLDPSWITVSDEAGSPVPGTLSYDASSFTLTFTPDAPLTEFEHVYSIAVSGVENTEGTPMSGADQATFSTEFLSAEYFYRLSNQFTGPDLVLDNYAGTRECYMADAAANTTGSFWHIEKAPGRTTYLMKSWFGGDDLALEGADGVNPCLLTGLAQPGFVFSGQLWSFTPIPEAPGTYRMQIVNLGSAMSLDVYNDGRSPEQAVMRDTGLFSGQAWSIVRSIERPQAAPGR